MEQILTFITDLAKATTTALAFDIGTKFMVSAFGYSFNATFAKRSSSQTSLFSLAGTPKQAVRGQILLSSFNRMVMWLVDHSWDIIFASAIAIFSILLIRYIFTASFHKIKQKNKIS